MINDNINIEKVASDEEPDIYMTVPLKRYEELVRAETERDVLEATICGKSHYYVENVMDAIKQARKAEAKKEAAQEDADAEDEEDENDAE